VAIVDGQDQVKYTLFRNAADGASVDVRGLIAASLALLRGRLSALPDNVIPVIAAQDLAKHGRSTALIQRFGDRPVIVAAVACIWGLGAPADYGGLAADIRVGQAIARDCFLRKMIGMQYRGNDLAVVRGTFRVRGDTLEFVGVDEELVHRIEFFGDEIEAINVVNQLTGEYVTSKDELKIFPAKHYITPDEKLRRAIIAIEEELEDRLKFFKDNGKLLEAQRLEQRTRYDLDMLREVGYSHSVVNPIRPLPAATSGTPSPSTLHFNQCGRLILSLLG